MPQSLSYLLTHIIFSTKDRKKYGIEYDERYVWD
jgi:hypothetical protein